MTSPRRHTDAARQPRRDLKPEQHVASPYRARGKYREPTTCPECGAIFHRGRWQWGTADPAAQAHLCPACLRIRDRVPGGELTLSGEFFDAHREEILHLVRNVGAVAGAEHPMERVIGIRDEPGRTVVTLTDGHLTHGLGEALHRAYEGELASRYAEADDLMRVSWTR